MTISPVRPSPHETVALARVASLRARGVNVTARAWESWIDDAATDPWIVVRPDELLLEVVFDTDSDLTTSRRTLARLLADRWSVVIRVHPGMIPSATAAVGDLPLRIEAWDQI